MTASQSTFITPAEACRRLEPFWPLTELKLEYWRRRNALPNLVRAPLGPDGGRGWAQGWTDPEILVQVATLKSAANMYCRVEWMKLAGWFAGFDYPPDDMRLAWRSWCRRDGIESIGRHLGGEAISDAELEEATRAVYDGLPPKRRRPSTLALLRAKWVPTFTGPSHEALDDASRQWRDRTHRDPPEMLVRSFFDLRRVFGSASLEAVISAATDRELADAHRDAHLLLTPLRLAAAEFIETGNGMLEALLLVLIGLGRYLHALSLKLRQAGYGKRIDKTTRHLRTFSAKPAIQNVFWEMLTFMQTDADMANTDPCGISPPSPEALIREYWDDPELRSASNTAWSVLSDTWGDLAGPIIVDLLDAGTEPFGSDQAGDMG